MAGKCVPPPAASFRRACRAGVWATLQFRWVQLQYPVAIIAAEKLLLTCSLPVAGINVAWGAMAALGASTAPFYAAAWLSGLYYLLARPLPSSFQAPTPKGAGAHSSVTVPCCAGDSWLWRVTFVRASF